ncbi:1-(5-phosphoribosyl)-5-((5-phosphoribosylamino)methylideneamino) imidazole-4-carboxamide isomerase [Candidatus Desulfarcum epimagneticum]|uniref:1-(5-phosphoribosyl)-5-[(5-phosphoribosylamino)methylideneamino] imidazole-4-carboxamide isomerase n=1 Tax=uncultured Desulfobacteraceae bacterium TaxID=218296 RepID=A0A484HKR1_9BACT|nr:1-(5-phosphoribosyl)-5-((5-phosphoribosylamino)methylideneamino) imidazole-4-carboxamide isomerase [uncultured Desulfobacteraceae bacterium]
MRIIPAIDIKDNRCVRLLQGRFEDETVFSDDPAAMAQRWAGQGARLIHVVDLDGAVGKKPKNLSSIKKILETVDVPIQVGGGIRDMETIAMYLDLGVRRLILGTVAIKDPELAAGACARFPGAMAAGIDARNGLAAIDGWTKTTDVRAIDLARRLEDAGFSAIIFTDIDKDGMEKGPNIEETRKLAEAVSIPVTASGGVSGIKDILNLLPLEKSGVDGIITGKALYTGALSLKEAMAAADGRGERERSSH